MVKSKDPREVREKVIRRHYGALKKMNFGSEKNMESESSLVMGFSPLDINMKIYPVQHQNTSSQDSNESYVIGVSIVDHGTHSSKKSMVSIEVDD
jgi:hypothetical protein